MDISDLVRLLLAALKNSAARTMLILEFQKQVHSSNGTIHSEAANQVLGELAADLDDPDFFDDSKTKHLIRNALAQLRASGVDVDKIKADAK